MTATATEEWTSVPTAVGDLRALTWIPDAPGPLPGIVLVDGSGDGACDDWGEWPERFVACAAVVLAGTWQRAGSDRRGDGLDRGAHAAPSHRRAGRGRPRRPESAGPPKLVRRDDSVLRQSAGAFVLSRLLGFDPVPAIQAVSCPVLALFGAADTPVPVPASVEAYAANLPGLPGNPHGIAVFPRADHGLFTADPDPAVPRTEQLAPGFLPMVAGFLSSQTS